MKFKVSKNIFAKLPDAKFGAILISGIDNSKDSPEINDLQERIIKETYEKISNVDLTKLPSIYTWRYVFDNILTDTKDKMASHEALLKRLKSQKTLPSISPLVDIYNSLSVKNMVPLGGHSTEGKNEISIVETNGDESFEAMGTGVKEKVGLGEFAYVSGKSVLTRHFVWRQSEFSKITKDTKEVFIPIDDATGNLSREKIILYAEEIIYLITKYLGGNAKFAILDYMNSIVDFDDLEEYELKNERNIKIEFQKPQAVDTSESKIDEILDRAISEILPSKEEFKKLLMSGKRITFYQGYDPSAASLHIGNAIGMGMLEKFRKLGHKIIFLIGTGTGKIGDPTDKDATRKVLTDDMINENIKGWITQANQVLNFNDIENPVQIVRNGDWLKPMTLDKFLSIGNLVTVQQLLERDMFKKRLEEGRPISVSELLYPLLQGFDSVAMEVDGEFGGNDQLFNMMMGRTLEKSILGKEKFVITGKILADSNGIKMGKSLGNVINLTDSSQDIYGKIMSFSDGMIANGFEILTKMSLEEIEDLRTKIEKGEINPIEPKKQLAFEVTKWIKGEEEAQKAKDYFEKTIQNQELPEEIEDVFLQISEIAQPTATNVFSEVFNISTSETKRMIDQSAIEIEGEKISDKNLDLTEILKSPKIIKLGKRKFKRVTIK